MSSKSRCLPDFESRSVALFASLARGGKPARAGAQQSGAARQPAVAMRRDGPRRHESSVEPELRLGAAPAEGDKDGSIPSAGFDEALK